MHAKLLISHRCLSVSWMTDPNGRLPRKGFELTAEAETEQPDSVNTSPFGILESGGSQHSMWKPRSHESQNSISSWKGMAGMCKGRPCCIHATNLLSFRVQLLIVHPIVDMRGFTNQQILRQTQRVLPTKHQTTLYYRSTTFLTQFTYFLLQDIFVWQL